MRKIICVALAVLAGLAFAFPEGSVRAGGTNAVLLDSANFSSLSSTDWDADDGVSAEDGVARFSGDGAENARLLYRTAAVADSDTDVYRIATTVRINALTGGSFGIGFGFRRSRYRLGDEGTRYFYFREEGGAIKAGLCVWGETGRRSEALIPLVSVSGDELDVELTAKGDGSVEISVNGGEVYAGSPGGEPGGYFAFCAEGAPVADVCSARVTNDYYDRPENVNVADDFEDGSVNASVWNISNKAPYMKGIAETGGQLRFIENQGGVVTTKYRYSNFAMRFEIADVKHTVETREDGTLLSPVSSWIGLFCGLSADDYSACVNADYIVSNMQGYFLSFTSGPDKEGYAQKSTTALFGAIGGRKSYALPARYHIWDEARQGDSLEVSLTSQDGLFNLDIRWKGESDWYHVFTEQYKTATGYISMTFYGSTAGSTVRGNGAFDNVNITNRDYLGNVVGVDETSNNLENPGDYGYHDSKSPAQLIADGTDFDGKSSGCGAVRLGGGILAAALILAGVALTGRRAI